MINDNDYDYDYDYDNNKYLYRITLQYMSAVIKEVLFKQKTKIR